MKVLAGEIYHVYNRGNQQQQLFFDDRNYQYFLGKVVAYLLPVTDILAFTLMPNHFHFLVYANKLSAALIYDRQLPISNLSEALRLLQCTYTKGFNAQYEKSGNLFHQKFKSKIMEDDKQENARNVLHYIHRNAEKAGLVSCAEDWAFSSYNEYRNPSQPGICNKDLTMSLLDLTLEEILSGVLLV
jgi:REP element-mobilizing transposase RayT